jgi:tetrahydromethanopterin S-methyltransferase subunit C
MKMALKQDEKLLKMKVPFMAQWTVPINLSEAMLLLG